MHADPDLLLTTVYCTADDLLPERRGNARRRLNDAEIVPLAVARTIMGVLSDPRFLRAARRQLGHLFPVLPSQDARHKRRARLAEAIEWLTGIFAGMSPGSGDDLLLLDSTPAECRRSPTCRTPPAGDFEFLRAFLRDLPRGSKVLIHCGDGNRAAAMICSCSTRPRPSAAEAVRRRSARSSPRSAATAARAATRAGSGAAACIWPARRTARPGLSPRSPPTDPNERWRSAYCRGRSEAVRR